MGEILNEGGSAPLVHTTVSVQQSANQKRRNAAQSEERYPIGQRRQKVPQGPNKTQQAQISRDDRVGIERREERLFFTEDHRQHRRKVQDQERFCGEEDTGMDDGQDMIRSCNGRYHLVTEKVKLCSPPVGKKRRSVRPEASRRTKKRCKKTRRSKKKRSRKCSRKSRKSSKKSRKSRKTSKKCRRRRRRR